MEFVFVVPRSSVFPECAPHGFVPFGNATEGGEANGQSTGTELSESWPREDFDRCVEKNGFFVERPYAERTPTLKQVIPYTLVVRGDDVLLLKRTKGGGEARLHHKLTIGVGGHINPVTPRTQPLTPSPRPPAGK